MNRKTLGTVTPSSTTVTAGGNGNLAITYRFSEVMEAGVVEFKLPMNWDGGNAPVPYQLDEDKPTADELEDDMTLTGYVFLTRLTGRLEGTTIAVNADDAARTNAFTSEAGALLPNPAAVTPPPRVGLFELS